MPLGTTYFRKTYMPPNSGSNSTFLETLRLLLVQERRGAEGAPRGLDLAFATPRGWLAPGKTIRVDNAPTSFGRLSYSIERKGSRIVAHVAAPPGTPSLRLRLRVPAREGLGAVRLGARRLQFDRTTGTVTLPAHARKLDLTATVARVGR